MLTYGFYNSVNHDRVYDAKQMSSIFDGIIQDGIYQSIGTAMIVKAYSGNEVQVGVGRAWFNHTWTLNDAVMTLKMPDPDPVFNRIDAVVLEVNAADSVRENTIKVVQGTPATSPIRPTLIKAEPLWQYPLAYIYRPYDSKSVSASQITNMVGTSETPFVSGVLRTLTLDEVLGQWRGELDEFVEDRQNEWNTWYTNLTNEMLAEQAALQKWCDDKKADFNKWFESIQSQLSGDIATSIIATITEETVNRIMRVGMTGALTTFSTDGKEIVSSANGNTLTIKFNDDGSITKTLVYDGVTYTRTTTFTSDGNIREV